MKKIVYILSLITIATTIFSCNQDIKFPYEGKDRVHFKHFTVDYNGKRNYLDSTVFSFGLKADSILKDTLKIVVELVGNVSQRDRKYNIEIKPDSTTAIEGVHYEPFSSEQIFRAKKIRDTLRIVILRENLNSDYLAPENKRLDLMIRESNDFDLGLTLGRKVKVILNNYMTEPSWWVDNFRTDLGYFHPEKWKILISFDDKFANENSCPYNPNNEGRGYVTGLRSYLDDKAIYEVIDGKKYRLKMYEKVLVEE